MGEFGAAANWAVGAWGIASLGAWYVETHLVTAIATLVY